MHLEIDYQTYKKEKLDKVAQIRKQMFELEAYKNLMEVPYIEKVVLTSSLSKHKYKDDTIGRAYKCLYLLSGLKPVFTRAKKSVANFKIRAKEIVGVKVTMRNLHMIEFIEKLISIYMPKVKGIKKIRLANINANGSFTIGIREISNFPEISSDLSAVRFGISICFALKKYNGNMVKPQETLQLISMFKIPTA